MGTTVMQSDVLVVFTAVTNESYLGRSVRLDTVALNS